MSNTITVTFKTPNALEYALDGLKQEAKDEAHRFCSQYIRYREYIDIEFDLDNQTVKVLKI